MATHQSDLDGAALLPVMAAIKRRDSAALAQLYEQTVDRLYGLVFRLLNNAQDAEDILNELYLKVWHEPERYDPTRGPVIAWLVIMARSRALDELRKRKLTQHSSLDESIEDCEAQQTPSPVDVLSQWQEGSRVKHALIQLTEVQRQLISLAFFEELSHAEIAAQMALPLGTVKSHLRRAQQTLKQVLEESSSDTVSSRPVSLHAG